MAMKKYLGESALEALVAQIKALDEADQAAIAAEAAARKAQIGEIPAKVGETDTATVKAYVDAKVAAATSEAGTEAQEIKDMIGEIAEGDTVAGLIADNAQAIADEEAARKAQIGDLGKVGESDTDQTVKGYVDAAVSEINGDAAALDGRVTTAEGKLDVIQGEGEGSIKKAASDAVATVLNGAPEAFDTLQEIAAWIGTGDVANTTAAAMLSDIATLKGADTVEGSVAKAVKDEANRIDGVIGTVPAKVGETATGTVVAYIDAKVAAANKGAEDAVAALDADVTSDDEAVCTVQVVEVNGVITDVVVVSEEITAAEVDALFAKA